MLVNDLIGLACVHLVGSRGVLDIVQRTGDLELALLVSIVFGRWSARAVLPAFERSLHRRNGHHRWEEVPRRKHP